MRRRIRLAWFDALDFLDRHQPRIVLTIVVTLMTVVLLGAASLNPPSTISGPVSSLAVPDVVPATTGTTRPHHPSVDRFAVAGTTPPTRSQPIQATDTLPPPIQSGVCDSWAPLLDLYGIPYPEAQPIMFRESRCKIGAHNYNPSTRDDSYGPFQVNRYGSLAEWWDSGGYTATVMATPEGAVAAAAVLFGSCGWSPWRKPYGCDGDYLQTPSPMWGHWPHQQGDTQP